MTPYLIIQGAIPLIEFIKKVFEAQETYRALQPDGRVKHAELRIGDSMIMIAEALSLESAKSSSIYLYVKNPDLWYDRALRAGGVSIMPPANRPTGERLAGIQDPSGDIWWIAAPFETDILAPSS